VRVNEGGRARVHYRCWCDEVPPSEGEIEFEIPSKADAPWWLTDHVKEEPAPDFAIDKTSDSTPRVGESMTFHINAMNQGGTALGVRLWDEVLM
jgi:hypothetical protein